MLHSEVIERFTTIARAEIRRDHIAASCIASTWIAVETFKRLGLQAEHWEVRASVGNGTYAAQWVKHGPPRTPDELERWFTDHGAHIVGIGFEQEVGGLGGHLIAVVDGTTVVDASLEQANDPAHDIIIPPVVVFDIDPRGLPLGIARSVTPSLFVEYQRHPVLGEYHTSPDWGRTREVRDAVERLVAAIQSDST